MRIRPHCALAGGGVVVWGGPANNELSQASSLPPAPAGCDGADGAGTAAAAATGSAGLAPYWVPTWKPPYSPRASLVSWSNDNPEDPRDWRISQPVNRS